MGRERFSDKLAADNLIKLSIYWLKKQCLLNGRRSVMIQWADDFAGNKNTINVFVDTDKMYIRLQYSQMEYNGQKKDCDYKISLVSEECNLGGARFWFICPIIKNGVVCGRRVGVLYKAGDFFACRHCYNLTYNSKKKHYGEPRFPDMISDFLKLGKFEK